MRLHPEWKRIARRAWSIRLGLLAAFFSGAEVVVPLFYDSLSRGSFAALSFITVFAALVARIVAQSNISGDRDG